MSNFAALFVPLALLLPFQVEQGATPIDGSTTAQLVPLPEQEPIVRPMEWQVLEGPNGMPVQYQVRIEQRVVIRISPQRPNRQNLTANNQPNNRQQRLTERKIGNCVKMDQIAGVQTTRGDRLMLYMKDRRLIAANLEKACSARDFYSGFYVEPSKDGNLCIERDKLQSRTGAKCELSRIRQLVQETI